MRIMSLAIIYVYNICRMKSMISDFIDTSKIAHKQRARLLTNMLSLYKPNARQTITDRVVSGPVGQNVIVCHSIDEMLCQDSIQVATSWSKEGLMVRESWQHCIVVHKYTRWGSHIKQLNKHTWIKDINKKNPPPFLLSQTKILIQIWLQFLTYSQLINPLEIFRWQERWIVFRKDNMPSLSHSYIIILGSKRIVVACTILLLDFFHEQWTVLNSVVCRKHSIGIWSKQSKISYC